MFTSQKVATHIESFKATGTKDKPAIQVAFYNTPLTFEFLYEIDDRIGKQLFRKEAGNHVPVAEIDDVTLKLGELPAFNMALYPHDADGADGAGQLIQAIKITKVEASKLFADKPDWSLIWHAILPMDKHTLELLNKYYKQTCYITLEQTQDELPFDATKSPIILDDASVECGQVIQCSVCEERATYLGIDHSGWCDPHLKGAVGIQVRKITYVGDAA